MHRFIRTFTELSFSRNVFINFSNISVCKLICQKQICTSFVQHSYNYQENTRVKKEFNISDLLRYVISGKVFFLKQLINVFHTIEFDSLDTNDAILLLKLCGSVVADSPRDQRNIICQDLFNGLKNANNMNINILNRYIKTCTENGILIYNKDFLTDSELINTDTFTLLLENVCELGRIDEAFIILNKMKKKNMSLNIENINSLILGHAINGGIHSAESVLITLRSAKITDNDQFKFALYKGLIRRKNLDEFKEAIQKYPIKLSHEDLLILIEELGLNELDSWLCEIENLYNHSEIITKDLQKDVEKICVHLIHMKKYLPAIKLYRKFVVPRPDLSYGFLPLKEMLHCNADISLIISVAKDLVDEGLNDYLLEALTGLALRLRYEDQSWTLLKCLNTVRPHYFWPLIVQNAKSNGDYGVFSTLHKIKEFDVKLDTETLEHYVIPNCDLTNLTIFMLKLQELKFTVREILSPLILVLLKDKRTKDAAELSAAYNVNIFGEQFLQHLAKSWSLTRDSQSVLTLLVRYCESNNQSVQDLVGNFLIYASKDLDKPEKVREFLTLVKLIATQRLKITPHSADIIQQICKPFININNLIHNEFNSSINSLVDITMSLPDDSILLHPRNMDINQLEDHLIELKEKRMETRGVLRKLITLHANKGNIKRVNELRQLFLDSGYEESPGTKSFIMHNYTIGGNLEEALKTYAEIKEQSPEFRFDNFKCIDLAKLLVQHNEFDQGLEILENELTIKSVGMSNTQVIVRNCRELLSACKSVQETEKMFNFLVQNGLCTTSNIMLGPLLRSYLKFESLNKAVDKYIELAKKYKSTPLQLEIISTVVKQQNTELLQRLLNATEEVHGTGATQMVLIAALAENNQEKALRNVLVNLRIPVHGLLQKRCHRWVEERKIQPLQCLAKAIYRLPQKLVHIDLVYKCIFNIYDLNNDYEGALSFIEHLPEDYRSVIIESELHRLKQKARHINRTLASEF